MSDKTKKKKTFFWKNLHTKFNCSCHFCKIKKETREVKKICKQNLINNKFN